MRLAYRFAVASDKITADGVEVTGFPDLARRYRISAVPKTMVGESVDFVGVQPESALLAHIMRASGATAPS